MSIINGGEPAHALERLRERSPPGHEVDAPAEQRLEIDIPRRLVREAQAIEHGDAVAEQVCHGVRELRVNAGQHDRATSGSFSFDPVPPETPFLAAA